MLLAQESKIVENLGSFEVIGAAVEDIRVERSPPQLVQFVRSVEEEIRHATKPDEIKDDPLFRAYRDFFWRIGIDPTKTRPASEALTRRIVNGRELPAINSFVDALNVESVRTKIPFAAFDADLVVGGMLLRYARSGETIRPIGHREEVILNGREIVIADREKLIAVYPHRDSDETKITERTERAVVLSCGVPGIEGPILRSALEACCGTVLRFCGGHRVRSSV
jgi:DNA/RNA-binding domain of Phe-tRNA-synthetase-like protein